MKIGIEMEFWVVDDDGRLCDGECLSDAHDLITPEFIGPLIEIRTSPHERKHGLTLELQEVLQAAIREASATGKHLVPLGTPLTTASPSAITQRGRLFEAIYGDGIESAKNCAGTHIHFERGNTLRQLNLLTALDPALALVNSSPYYCGERTMSSSRAFAYRKQCGSAFREYCDLWQYAESVGEWESRVENAFSEFKQLAQERGVPPEIVDAHFCPADTVLNPVRLRDTLPTVEWRAPDTAHPSQILELAFDVRELVEQTSRKPVEIGETGVNQDRIGIPAFSKLSRLSEKAIRDGLGSAPVRTYLERMRFDVESYASISERIDGPQMLTDSMARDIRLEYARRLRDDVRSLTPSLQRVSTP